MGGAVHALGATMEIPFGPFQFGPEAGPQLFKTLPWAMPLIWVAAILNSRGVVRLILRPWRKIRSYGFWLIGLTAVPDDAVRPCLRPVRLSGETLLALAADQIPADLAGRAAGEIFSAGRPWRC